MLIWIVLIIDFVPVPSSFPEFDYLFCCLGKNSTELAALNKSLQDLLDGIQVCLELTLSL